VAPADDVMDDTVPRPARPAAAPRPVFPPVSLSDDVEDTITVSRVATPPPSASAAMPPPLVEPPAAPPSIDHDDTATVTPRLPETGALPGNVWSEPVPARPRPFRLRLDDGTLVPLDQPVYLGRKPSVPRIHPGGIPLLVTLDSPAREVSSTHLQLTMIGGAIVASDMRSANGSVLRVPGAAPRTLLGGASAVVTPGTVIELGDGNRVELLEPAEDHADAAVGGAAR
jgi:hypothetical protein